MYAITLAAATALLSGVSVLAAPQRQPAALEPRALEPRAYNPTHIRFNSQTEFEKTFSVYGGAWKVTTDNDLLGADNPNLPGSKATLKDTYQGSYSYSTSMKITKTTPGTGNAGIIFSARSLEVGVDTYHGWYAGINPDNGKGVASLVVGKADGSWHALDTPELPDFKAGEWYRFRVDALDNQNGKPAIVVYLEGVQKYTITSVPSNVPKTNVAVGFRLFNAAARYDDLSISSL